MTEPQSQPPYPPQGQWPPPPPKKRKKWPFIVGGLIVLIVILAVAVPKGSAPTSATTSSGGGGASAQPADTSSGTENVVTYEVTGPAKASVTYMTEGFQTAQVQDAKLPFRKDIQFTNDVGKFSGLSLVAQNSGAKGDITCRILLDGKEVASNTSSGAYAVVTCTGANI